MLRRLAKRYLIQFSFVLALLVGLQIPNFLSDYQLRLDAHLMESNHQLGEYQKLANVYFSGDLSKLIDQHRESEDAVFQDEAEVIEALMQRVLFFKLQQNALSNSFPNQLIFLVKQVNTPLFLETKQHYKAEILLNQRAIFVGLFCGLLVALLLESLFFIFAVLISKQSKKK